MANSIGLRPWWEYDLERHETIRRGGAIGYRRTRDPDKDGVTEEERQAKVEKISREAGPTIATEIAEDGKGRIGRKQCIGIGDTH